MAIRRLLKQGWILSSVFPVRSQRPQDNRFATEHPAQGLTVSVPELILPDAPIERSATKLPQDHGQRIVQPDDHLSAIPDDIAHSAVVAIHNPGVASHRVSNPCPEDPQWHLTPVWTPVQGIEFHVRDLKAPSDLTGRSRLT
jgi:hypothetical protein